MFSKPTGSRLLFFHIFLKKSHLIFLPLKIETYKEREEREIQREKERERDRERKRHKETERARDI